MGGTCEACGRWRFPKRAMLHVEVGRIGSGMPRLRWNDCVETDFKRAGVDDNWRVRAMDSGSLRALVNDAAVIVRVFFIIPCRGCMT